MNYLHRFGAWHLAHKGETVAHLAYLSLTFVEGHGAHAIAAGMVGVFVVIGVIGNVIGGSH